ncbi:hypothetical protein CTI12_AA194470 [Artemisia annua]|uniref:Uncharacterized protein n=1 Tax=Artemisia annua TaxID=35608 RepID=A0A2U1MJ26_ARTAN|nr:hypothetical protein CTI12_AA194470 [Artemisia annua]
MSPCSTRPHQSPVVGPVGPLVGLSSCNEPAVVGLGRTRAVWTETRWSWKTETGAVRLGAFIFRKSILGKESLLGLN